MTVVTAAIKLAEVYLTSSRKTLTDSTVTDSMHKGGLMDSDNANPSKKPLNGRHVWPSNDKI